MANKFSLRHTPKPTDIAPKKEKKKKRNPSCVECHVLNAVSHGIS